MVFLGWLLGIVVAIVVIAIVVVFLNRFYRKSTRDVALVRTGFGGQRSRDLRRLPGAAVPAQGRRDQHAHDPRGGAAHRREVADHRRPHPRGRRARVLRARAAHRRGHRHRRAGDRLAVVQPRGHPQPAGRPLRRRAAVGGGRRDHGQAAREARRVRPARRRAVAREPVGRTACCSTRCR